MNPFSGSVRKSVRKMLTRMFTRTTPHRRSPLKWRLEELEPRDVPATYYVATGGSDGAAGDSAHPFRTIQHAADQVIAGDTVVVRAGTYAGFILGWDFTTAGTAAAPITFQADPAAAAGSVVINARNGKTPVGIDIEPGCDYITVQGFTIDGTGFASSGTKYGIKITGDHDRVIGNTVKDFFDAVAGIHSNGANATEITGNSVYNIGANGVNTHGHGIYIANGDGIVVRGNTLYDNDFIGIHVNGDPNVVSHALIEDNVIHDNGQNGINADGLVDSTIRNNLIYGYASYGIALYQIDSSDPPTGNVIVNNTIVSTKSGAGAAVRIKNGGTGNTVLNNVLLGGGGVSLRIAGDSLSGLTSDYNVVGSLFQSDDNGSTQSLSSWRTSSGQDTHSFTSTTGALFVDAANGDYHLASGSPAIDSGTSTNAPATDFEGTSRSGAVDIGFDEYASSSPSSTTHFSVSAPSGATAGTSFSVTVSALTSSNAVDTNYRGTIHFASSDGQAVLPSNYTFTAGDNGSHTFTVTLKTAGSRSVTATDTTAGSVTGSASISVAAAAASTIQLSVPAGATAGTSFNVTATAKDAYGNVATGYRGTVRFNSNDGQAVLPSNYTFTAGDNGAHTFAVTLKTAGSRTVTVTDTATGSLTANASVSVTAAAASTLQVSAPSSATAGTAFTLTVTAKDAYGNTATGYRGAVRFTSTDGQAVLPSNYTFTAGDAGAHNFSVTLKTTGSQSVTVTDTVTGAITGNATVSVGSAPVSPPPPASPPPAPPPVPPAPAAPAPAPALVPPIVAGAPFGTDTVRVLNPDGSTFRAITPHPGFLGGIVAAAGDVNGDGVADVVTVATSGGHVKLFDGVTGAEMWSFFAYPGYSGPISVGIGDLNGDRRAEVLVAANLHGHIRAYDGASGALSVSYYAYFGFVGTVALAAADVDGNGRAELLTAADAGAGVHVKAVDPFSGALLASFFGTAPGPVTSYSLAAGDLDGDRVAEFLVAKGSRVRVLDGVTKAARGDFDAFPGFTGKVFVEAAQGDADALAEPIAVADIAPKPAVKVFGDPAGTLIGAFWSGDR